MHSTQPNATSKPQPAIRLSALEIGAKRGIGPLSDYGVQVWHGHARPCVSCGELMRREGKYCEFCGQEHSLAMLSRMEAHAGPWYVHEHVRPFPGVTLERLIRQAKRGVLTASTIVRGPTTHHQWRFAGETPGLCKYVGMCFNCLGAAADTEVYCPSCGIHLDRVPGDTESQPETNRFNAAPSRGTAAGAATQSLRPATSEANAAIANRWDEIHSAARQSRHAEGDALAPRRSTRIPAWVFVLALIVLFVGALVIVVQIRDKALTAAEAKRKADTSARSIESPATKANAETVDESTGARPAADDQNDAPVTRRDTTPVDPNNSSVPDGP